MDEDQAAAGLKNNKQAPFPGTGLKIFLGILALGMVLLTVYMSGIKSGYRKDLRALNESFTSLSQQNSLLKQTKICLYLFRSQSGEYQREVLPAFQTPHQRVKRT